MRELRNNYAASPNDFFHVFEHTLRPSTPPLTYLSTQHTTTMSESLAAFRTSRSKDLAALAEEHLQHEYVHDFTVDVTKQLLTRRSLNQQDRDLLKSAGSKVGTHAMIGSLAGLGLGVYFAMRLRNMRLAYFRAFRAMEKPVEVRFADGRTGTCNQALM